MKLFSLIESLSLVHSASISKNIKNGSSVKGESSEDNEKIEQLIRQFWNKFSVENISLETFIQGVKDVSKTKNKLWNSYKESLWVESFYNGHDHIYLPNIYDLLKVIFNTSEKEDRQKHFHQFTKYYYTTLKQDLNYRGLDLEDILSKNEFEENIDQFLPCIKLDILKHWLENYDEFVDNIIKDLVEELVEYIICPIILREDCYKILERLNCLDCDSFMFQLKSLNSEFGNMGNYYKLKLFVKHSDSSKELNFFVKTPPVDNEIVKSIALPTVEKEEFFYSTYISELEENGFGDLVDFAPKVYFVRKHHVLVLEDLEEEDYRAIDIRDPSKYEIMCLTLQKIAKLHASSLVFEDYKSKIFGKRYRLDEEYGKYFKETLLFKENQIFNTTSKYACNYCPSRFTEVLNGINLNEFQNKATKMYESVYQLVLKSSKYRNVISHGDLWTGNLLYRLTPNKLSCCLVDFQMMRYVPPLLDVLMYLYIQTDKRFRDAHLKDLLSVYRKCLGDILKRYHMDINDFYDENTFSECVEHFKQFGIITGLFYTLLLTLPVEINPYRSGNNDKKMEFIFGDRELLYDAVSNSDVFIIRNKGYIEDMFEYLK